MSTRSTINIKFPNEQYIGIYCHFDGYPDGGVGDTLLKHYNSLKDVYALIMLGHISSLSDTFEDTSKDAYTQRGEDWNIYTGNEIE